MVHLDPLTHTPELPLETGSFCLDNDNSLVDLQSNVEPEFPNFKNGDLGMVDSPPLDLFCNESLVDPALSPQISNKQVKVQRVTLQKTADGVHFLVDPLPNALVPPRSFHCHPAFYQLQFPT